jgi:hypothetical protein
LKERFSRTSPEKNTCHSRENLYLMGFSDASRDLS